MATEDFGSHTAPSTTRSWGILHVATKASISRRTPTLTSSVPQTAFVRNLGDVATKDSDFRCISHTLTPRTRRPAASGMGRRGISSRRSPPGKFSQPTKDRVKKYAAFLLRGLKERSKSITDSAG